MHGSAGKMSHTVICYCFFSPIARAIDFVCGGSRDWKTAESRGLDQGDQNIRSRLVTFVLFFLSFVVDIFPEEGEICFLVNYIMSMLGLRKNPLGMSSYPSQVA
jgi:hypothetical protein